MLSKVPGKVDHQKGKSKHQPVDRNNFETFHAIKRDVENHDAKECGKHYWFKVLQYQEASWIPQAREGALLLNHTGTNDFYLYGGVAQEPCKGLAKLNTEKYPSNACKWDIAFPKYHDSCDPTKL